MTDTHTHLYMPDVYDDGGSGAVARAIAAGVTRIIFPCVNLASLPEMKRLHGEFPDNTAIAIGLHPTDLEGDWRGTLDEMESILAADPSAFCAVGETGIDLYHDSSMAAEQKEAFLRQIGWARKYRLPVIIHCREALEETLETLQQAGVEELPPLIFHSFTGTPEDVARIREVCDPWFGINGVVTFKNAPRLREALPLIGLDRMLLETDAPWLSPAPHRGKTNESSRIPFIRDCIAATLGVDPAEVEKITDRNAAVIFEP